MAGFTSLALVGAGLLAGKLLNRGKKPEPPPLAPPPTDAGQRTLAPPAPPILNPAEVQAAGQTAAIKTRKRAAQGSLLTNAKPVKSMSPPVAAARPMPRSLIGY